jgi:N-acetylglucosamine-6-phosphate deacetylase
VIVEDGVSKMPDRKSFAGSVATADRLVRTMIQIAGVSITDAIRMMTMTPATIMKISGHKGSLISGKDADVVIFDEDINVHTTMVKGKVIYQAPVK